MKTHTPGPWKYYDNSVIDGTFRIMSVNDEASNLDIGKFRLLEDARLSAAAPEMLEALEKFEAMYFDFSRQSFDLVEIRSIIKTALEKARGNK